MNPAADLLPRFRAAAAGLGRAGPSVVAVSGGCDSVVLFDLLRRAGFRRMVVAHFNHGLRGAAAAEDARFVEALACRHRCRFVMGRGRTRARASKRGESIEEAARALRRAFLAATAGRNRAGVIFLGHHAGDAAETMLFHLARGGGPRGLSALRARAPLEDSPAVLVRPLLGFTRREIEAHATARGLAFRTDATNAARDHTRNRIRHDVLPALAAAVGFAPEAAMARAAAILADEDEWLESLVAEPAGAEALSTRAFRGLPAAAQRRLLRAWIRRRTGLGIDAPTTEAARALALSAAAPSKMNLPAGRHLRRRAGILFIEPRAAAYGQRE